MRARARAKVKKPVTVTVDKPGRSVAQDELTVLTALVSMAFEPVFADAKYKPPFVILPDVRPPPVSDPWAYEYSHVSLPRAIVVLDDCFRYDPPVTVTVRKDPDAKFFYSGNGKQARLRYVRAGG